jgi:ABC-2 type transport system ATP-binding protein
MSWGVENLRVTYGAKVALDGVDLEAPPGEVTAVVGGDGAGKSTLLRVLAGLPIAYSGSVRRPGPAHLGYVPTTSGSFRDLTVAENCQFVAQAHRLADWRDRARPLLERTGLAPFADRLAGNLSGGMRRKLGVIMAMLHEPALLVLDEPTTGIDPVSRSEVWRLLALSAARGAAVVLSSAYLDEAERATSVLVLHHGRPLAAGSPDEVRASMPGAVIETTKPSERSRAWRRGPIWREWRPEGSADAVTPDLEDVVIVASLAGGGR